MTKSPGQVQSQKHERRLKGKYGGRVTAASGAFWSRKGDVITDDYLIEHKYTSKNSATVSRAVLDKIEGEAISEGLTPILALHIGGRDYVVLTEEDFDELRGG